MRTDKTCLFVISFILAFTGTALAVDYVDIGNPASEAGYAMLSWGPIEPATSGGAYGGIDDCRCVWTPSDNSINASIDLMFAGGIELVSFKHLEGQADDSFQVFLDGVLMFTNIGAPLPETWFVSGFQANVTPGLHTVEFVATGPAWSGWGTYGQIAISDIWVGPGGPVSAETDTWGGIKSLYR